MIDPLTALAIARQIEALGDRYRARLKELSDQSAMLRRELMSLEAEAQGGPLPDGLARLEEIMIPQERVVVEEVEEEVVEEVKEGGFMGIGGRTRQVSKTVTRQRNRKVTEHARCRVEVYSLEGVEFKLVQVPDRPLAMGQTQVI